MSINEKTDDHLKDHDISVILPAYNEEDNIIKTLDLTSTFLKNLESDYEIIVVNDGSTDNTADLVCDMISIDPSIQLVQHPVNLGYGAALKSGLKKASRSLVFFTDSDQQFDISEISRLFEWINSYPIVIGYREARQDHFIRRAMGWGWGMLIRVLFKLNVKDIDCAFKLFQQRVFNEISIDSIGAFVNSEILIRAKKKGFAIKEVSVAHYPRESGVPSGAKPRIIFRAFKELVKLYRELK
jgi:glycosyltransferase involved in cell wall biosynthesis